MPAPLLIVIAWLLGALVTPAEAQAPPRGPRLSLHEAVAQYLARSPDLASDRLVPTIATIEVALAAERFRPQVAIEALGGRQAYNGPALAVGPTASVDLPIGGTVRSGVLYTPGSRFGEMEIYGSAQIPLLRGAGTEIATAELRIAGLQAQIADLALTVRISDAAALFAREFVVLDTVVRRRAEADDALRRAREQLRVVRGLVERGILAAGDTLELEAAAVSREIDATELAAEAGRQRELVLGLLGRDTRQQIETVLPDPLRWTVPPDEELRAAARRRPSVRLRELRLTVAEENRKLAADNLRWDLSIVGDVRVRGGGIDSRNYYADQRIGSGDLVYNLGLRVTIPITTQAAELRLSRAGTEMERARLEVQAAIEAAEREVLQRRAALRRELDRRTLTERLLSVSRQKLEIDRQRLQLGRGTALQFRLSEEEFVRARGQLTADRARVLIAWIDLLNASSSFQLPR